MDSAGKGYISVYMLPDCFLADRLKLLTGMDALLEVIFVSSPSSVALYG